MGTAMAVSIAIGFVVTIAWHLAKKARRNINV